MTQSNSACLCLRAAAIAGTLYFSGSSCDVILVSSSSAVRQLRMVASVGPCADDASVVGGMTFERASEEKAMSEVAAFAKGGRMNAEYIRHCCPRANKRQEAAATDMQLIQVRAARRSSQTRTHRLSLAARCSSSSAFSEQLKKSMPNFMLQVSIANSRASASQARFFTRS